MCHKIDRRIFLQHTSFGDAATMGVSLFPISLQAAGKKDDKATIEASLELLNAWEKKSKDVNDLYTAIYKVLQREKDATFADVAQDAAEGKAKTK